MRRFHTNLTKSTDQPRSFASSFSTNYSACTLSIWHSVRVRTRILRITENQIIISPKWFRFIAFSFHWYTAAAGCDRRLSTPTARDSERVVTGVPRSHRTRDTTSTRTTLTKRTHARTSTLAHAHWQATRRTGAHYYEFSLSVCVQTLCLCILRCTNTFLLFVARYRKGWRGVWRASCRRCLGWYVRFGSYAGR